LENKAANKNAEGGPSPQGLKERHLGCFGLASKGNIGGLAASNDDFQWGNMGKLRL